MGKVYKDKFFKVPCMKLRLIKFQLATKGEASLSAAARAEASTRTKLSAAFLLVMFQLYQKKIMILNLLQQWS